MASPRQHYNARRRELYRLQGREDRRQRNLLANYGLTIAQYEAMAESQGYECAICERPDWEVGRLRVDHDHETGEVRQLLCTTCNIGIGALQDDPSLMEKAAAYLRRHGRI